MIGIVRLKKGNHQIFKFNRIALLPMDYRRRCLLTGMVQKQSLQTITNGSSEIKNELEAIFKDILINKWKNHKILITT